MELGLGAYFFVRMRATFRRLREEGGYDFLTAVHTRREGLRLGADLVLQCYRHGFQVAAVVLDIDHFKQINDRFGHQEGDRALQQVARLIQMVPKRITDAAFRTGGEEFAILMTDTDKNGALTLSESLRSLTESARFFNANRPVTVSLGVASFPADGQDPTSLMLAADRALYQAKAAGRNRVQAA